MTKMQLKKVSIAAGADRSSLSKAQKTFNALIRQIEQGRAKLAAWEAVDMSYKRKYATELQPLFTDTEALQIKMVHSLDCASTLAGLSKAERREIAIIITDLLQELLSTRDDAALKAIFNKYSEIDYDAAEAADKADMKSVLEDMLGFELGDDIDLSNPDGILEHAQAKIHERQAQENAKRQARIERETQRKKSAKQLAREAQQQEDEQQLRLSIREIYRKLASALHPDRETDPLERERKTALMQRVNQAYDKKNLLLLLELQLELEQIDQAAINNVSEDRLKHYNRILREQLAELQHEILRVESGYATLSVLDPFMVVTPQTVIKELSAQILNVKRAIGTMKNDLLAFEDIQKLKAWLKRQRRAKRQDSFDDCPF